MFAAAATTALRSSSRFALASSSAAIGRASIPASSGAAALLGAKRSYHEKGPSLSHPRLGPRGVLTAAARSTSHSLRPHSLPLRPAASRSGRAPPSCAFVRTSPRPLQQAPQRAFPPPGWAAWPARPRLSAFSSSSSLPPNAHARSFHAPIRSDPSTRRTPTSVPVSSAHLVRPDSPRFALSLSLWHGLTSCASPQPAESQ